MINVFIFCFFVTVICIVAGLLFLLHYGYKHVNKSFNSAMSFLIISMLPLFFTALSYCTLKTEVNYYSNTESFVESLNSKIEMIQILNENQTNNVIVNYTIELMTDYNDSYSNYCSNIQEYSQAIDKNFIEEHFQKMCYDYISNQVVFANGDVLTQVEYTLPEVD